MRVHGGVVLTGMLFVATMADGTQIANAADVPVKAPAAPVVVAEPGWETLGVVEFGWRAYVQRPADYNIWWAAPVGSPWAPAGQAIGQVQSESIAKFWEYGSIKPGPYLQNLDVATVSKDGLYWGEVRVNDFSNDSMRYVGADNYRVAVDLMKTGEHYLSGYFDRIPHLYSTGAWSIWNGVGTPFVTTNVALPGIPSAPNAAQQATIAAQLNANMSPIGLGIVRDFAGASYRWTPDPNWDFQAAYGQDHREGTQSAGIYFGASPAAANAQVVNYARPIDDTTRNAKVSGQYFGDTPWGKFNVQTSGGVSLYNNEYNAVTVQNPFYTASTAALTPQFGRVSLAPDNQAYAAQMTSGVDLPFRTRYMATLQYTSMQQDDPFIPFTINPVISTSPLPALSPHAQIDTLLYNSQTTTKVTDTVKSTFKYRYYDLDNKTPELLFPNYVVEDSSAQTTTSATVPTCTIGGQYTACASGIMRRNLALAYTKQNASEDLGWRPASWLNLGTGAFWERWDRDRREANITNEVGGKIYGDARVFDVGQFRTSWQYSERRYDSYDPISLALYTYNGNTASAVNNFNLRKFDMANRDQQKAMTIFQIDGLVPNLSISPSAGFRFDNYKTDPLTNEIGLLKDNSWNAGIEVAYAFNAGTRVMVAYVHEDFDRDLVGSAQTTTVAQATVPPLNAAFTNPTRFASNMREKVDTIVVAANIDLIPAVLDLGLNYAIALGNENWTATAFGNLVGNQCTAVPNVACNPFPPVQTNFQRFESVLRYRVDPALVSKLGWTGDVIVKGRYVWERNEVANWQDDWTTPYMYLVDPATARNINMAAFSPNYNAHLVGASMALKW